MKVLFFLGARSEWGYISPILSRAHERGWDVSLCVSNLILLAQNKSLLQELEEGGYRIAQRIFSGMAGDSTTSMAKSVGLVTLGFVDTLLSEQPDWVVLAGDRVEQLGAAVASSTMYVPTAHIQGGERSGNIDGVNRHAISKLAHIHFASNEDASKRLIKLGEEPWRVFLSGAPQIDSLLEVVPLSVEELLSQRLIGAEDFVLAVMHGVTESRVDFDHLQNLMEELCLREQSVTWILPNNDAGGQMFTRYILENKRPGDFAFSNVSRQEYVSLMARATYMVGNSSSGILEAPSLGLPAVNVGVRQLDRLQAENVVNADGSRESIRTALEEAASKAFRESLDGMSNPYGDGRSVHRILDALESLRGREGITVKKISY